MSHHSDIPVAYAKRHERTVNGTSNVAHLGYIGRSQTETILVDFGGQDHIWRGPINIKQTAAASDILNIESFVLACHILGATIQRGITSG